MKLGNAAEQLEAAWVETMIESVCAEREAVEVGRTYEVDEDNALIVHVTIQEELPVSHVTVNLVL